MNHADDEALLHAFVENHSQDAFRLLVERYSGLVYGVALRRAASRELAEEVAQNVFTILARKAGRLSGTGSLAPWLHRTAYFEAAKLQRAESRRFTRMKKLQDESVLADDGTDVWAEVRPLLDESIERLSEADRRVLVLHYFEGLSFKEIAGRLGSGADTAQKRSVRALEKLAGLLKRKGVAITATALAAGLSTQVAQAAPPALAASVTASALTGVTGTVAGLTTKIMEILLMTTKTKIALAAVVAIAAVGTPVAVLHLRSQPADQAAMPEPQIVNRPLGGYVPVDQLVFAGYGSPYLALESFLWAFREGNFEVAVASITDKLLAKTMRERRRSETGETITPRQQFEQEARAAKEQFRGMQILGEKQLGDDHFELKVWLDEDKAQRLLRIWEIRKVGEEWRVGEEDAYREDWEQDGKAVIFRDDPPEIHNNDATPNGKLNPVPVPPSSAGGQ